MAGLPQSLTKLQEYIGKTQEYRDLPFASDPDEDYEVWINKSLHSLQTQVKQHEAALEQVHLGLQKLYMFIV